MLQLGSLAIAPSAMILTPALIGSNSVLSCEPPSGNMPMDYPCVNLFMTASYTCV